MNNTFDIRRFGNVVRRDGMSYFKNFGWTLVVLWSIPILHWIMVYVSMETSDSEVVARRDILISVLQLISLIIVPSRLYKNVNDSRKGMLYAMTPASSLEKFLSMFLYCVIVTPTIYMLGAIAVDTLLALKPGTNPYDGFILGDLFNHNLSNSSVTINYVGDRRANAIIAEYIASKSLWVYRYVCILCISSIFMFTNMLFKKRKLSKTIGILTLVGIIFMILTVVFTVNIDYEFLEDYTADELVDYMIRVYDCVFHFVFCTAATLSIIFLYFTYRRIKKQTY